MRYKFYTCDVFTEMRFGGNPLAVLPDASGLTNEQMQQIAREFNYSESTFVLPSENGYTRQVRIFTPTTEVPFAGHPNIGTAFVLASSGELGTVGGGSDDAVSEVVFEEEAGPVPIKIEMADGRIWCELCAPQPLTIGEPLTVDQIAAAISLDPAQIVTTTHQPQQASVGLPFVITELKDRNALAAARPYLPIFDEIHAQGIMPDLFVYVHSQDEFDIRARMFAPLDNVPEDPATGSATCALAAMLTHYRPEAEGAFKWRLAQGVEMGRPSTILARTSKELGEVNGVWVGGTCQMVAEGYISV